ncbi:hypothetical protein PAXRUDRAFT_136759, partial [Paxillus rubicundulus Ve08.2h10]
YLKVNYKSTITWKLATNYLRCNQNFHGHKHYDCALIRTHNWHQRVKSTFVHLHFMFCYDVGGHTVELALVTYMDVPNGAQHMLDKDL